MNDLEALEQRVTQRWINAASDRIPEWPLPDDITFSLDDWAINSVPLDWPQFPREQWLVYPYRQQIALLICDRALDRDLSEEEWLHVCFLMMYGGKERVA